MEIWLKKHLEFKPHTWSEISSGLPRINIPLHTIESGTLSLPLELSYNAGGFKAIEKSGAVGLGWSLSTDIQITRVVRGLDDFAKGMNEWQEFQYGYYYRQLGAEHYGYGDPNILHQGTFLPGGYLSAAENAQFNKALHEDYRGNVDIQPDCFYYSLLSGKSGKFYFQNFGDGWQ